MNTTGPLSNSRRRFLSNIAGAAGAGCLMAMGSGLYARQASALPAQALRPPGALAEEQFLSACLRCGLCVRDCPYHILKLAPVGNPVATGTPYFEARELPPDIEVRENSKLIDGQPTYNVNNIKFSWALEAAGFPPNA